MTILSPAHGRWRLLSRSIASFHTSTPLTAAGSDGRDPPPRSTHYDFRGLEPGKFVTYQHDVPVDIVLIGFDDLAVNRSDIRRSSPSSTRPSFDILSSTGSGRNMGLRYSFDYTITRASQALTTKFFPYLGSIGTAIQPTPYQLAYNAQERTSSTSPDRCSTSRPRASSAGSSRTQTRGAPATRSTSSIGTAGKTSASMSTPRKTIRIPIPSSTSAQVVASHYLMGRLHQPNLVLRFFCRPRMEHDELVCRRQGSRRRRRRRLPDAADLGILHRRLSSARLLGHDMGLLSRFVAINLLFTTSPLYDPMVTAPDPLGRKVVDMTMFEDDPASKGMEFIDPEFAKARWQELQPYYNWKTALRAVDPIDPGAKTRWKSSRGTPRSPIAGCPTALRSHSSSAISPSNLAPTCRHTAAATTLRQCSTSTPPRKGWALNSVSSASPMTTGSTAHRASSSPSGPTCTATRASVSPAR